MEPPAKNRLISIPGKNPSAAVVKASITELEKRKTIYNPLTTP
jgi:hypothetical protein